MHTISMTLMAPALLCAALATSVTTSYPIDAVPLRSLCDEADLIVRARVAKVAPFAVGSSGERTYFRVSKTATLAVESVLKGTLRSSRLTVGFNPRIVCPEPARYTENASVLAFLHWSERRSMYFTTGLSYGLKELDEPGYQVYEERIWEYFEIRSRVIEPREEEALIVDWLVKLAVDPVTRWEGAFELAETEGAWPPRRESEGPGYIHRSKEDHVEKLRRALYAEGDLLDLGNQWLVRVLYELRDPDLPLFLIRFLREFDINADGPSRSLLTDLMLIAARMKTKAQAISVTEDFRESLVDGLFPWEEGAAEHRRRSEELFKEYLRIMANCRW